MPQMQQYPSSMYEVEPPVDLSNLQVRERLSFDALRAFFRIIEFWKIRGDDARQLLGGISNGTYHGLKNNPDRVLNEDTLRRISYLIGIYKALHILHGEELADKWIQLPNKNTIFDGKTPLQYLIKGGMPAFEIVRKLLDARRGGL